MSLIYNQTLNTSNDSRAVRTVIINGNNELHSMLLQHGYSNYSVTSIPYTKFVPKVFASCSGVYHVASKELFASHFCHTVETTVSDDDEYFSARQSPISSTNFNNDNAPFDNDFDNFDYNDVENDDEPRAKRVRRHHHKYGKIFCGCLQQCQVSKN